MKWIGIALCVLLVSCASNNVKKEVELKPLAPASPWKKSPVAWVNGAEVYSEVEPLYGEGAIEKAKLIYRAGTANFDGPFNWRFVAEGDPAVHKSMSVDAVQITTKKTGRRVDVPKSMLGKQVFAFEEIKQKRRFSFKKQEPEEEVPPRWMAMIQIPGALQLYPKADGRVVVAARITVETDKGAVSEWVNFALLPNSNKLKSFNFRQTMVEYGGVPID